MAVGNGPGDGEALAREFDDSPRSLRLLLPYLVLALGFVAGAIGLSHTLGRPEPQRIEIVIPEGFADGLANGQDPNLIDDDLVFSMNDTLVLVNRDRVAHRVGPYQVAPGETISQTFTEVAVFEGGCSLHAGGEVTIAVQP